MTAGKVIFNMSMSLDGFVAGPNDEVDRLFAWCFSGDWVNKPDSPFTFVTDGIESAVLQAKKAVGDKNVAIATATTMRQCLKAGLLDEITIDLIPVLLGSGVRLFERIGIEPVELEIIRAVEAPGVTHLRYRVVKRDQES